MAVFLVSAFFVSFHVCLQPALTDVLFLKLFQLFKCLHIILILV